MKITLNDLTVNQLCLEISKVKNQDIDFDLWYELEEIFLQFKPTHELVQEMIKKMVGIQPNLTQQGLFIKLEKELKDKEKEYEFTPINIEKIKESKPKCNHELLRIITTAAPTQEKKKEEVKAE